MEEEADSITELQKDIEKQLEKDGKIKGRSRKKCKGNSLSFRLVWINMDLRLNVRRW